LFARGFHRVHSDYLTVLEDDAVKAGDPPNVETNQNVSYARHRHLPELVLRTGELQV
jgi:hypothetical protein